MHISLLHSVIAHHAVGSDLKCDLMYLEVDAALEIEAKPSSLQENPSYSNKDQIIQ